MSPASRPRTIGSFAVILMCIGCAAPVAQQSQGPSATTPESGPTLDVSPSQQPTDPSTDGLIVKLEGAGEAGRVHIVTVFDDGRVSLTRTDGSGTSLLVERRLSAAGVDLVRAELAATRLVGASADYLPVPNPGVEPPGYGGVGPSLEVGLPDGGTALITWYLFADTEADYFQPQPEAEALDALAARLSSLEDWLPAEAWADVTGNASTPAFEAPDGVLPPNSIVQVVVDRLQLRDEPGLAGTVESTAVKGETFSVAGWYGPVRLDGIDWYRLGPATVGDLDAWAAAGSGADTYLELVGPDCPAANPDLATVIGMASSWDRLACFGDHSLTLEGTFGCGICDGMLPGEFEPPWLAHPLAGNFLWVDFQAGVGPLTVYLPSGSDVERPAMGSIVRVTGHFNDPASTTCTMSTFDRGLAIQVDQQTAELYCREHFVLDSLDVIGSDPSYTDPHNP